MPKLVVPYEENGYRFVEPSPELKQALLAVPCFAAMTWPDYSTEIVEDTINGKPVVIQLWKGWFQRFLGSDEFLGGFGAEVGIYERVTGRGFPAAKPDRLPDWLWNSLREFSKHAGKDLWFPVTELNEIEYEFINPVNDTTFFRAGPEKTYWLAKWMAPSSYHRYQQAQGKKWNWLPAWFPKNSQTPAFAAQYVLRYKINGKSYAW